MVTKKKDKNAFVKVVTESFKMDRQRIPPRCCTWNGDVEAGYRMIEDDFYEVKSFLKTLQILKQKLMLIYYILIINVRWRDKQSPYNILVTEVGNKISSQILNLPPPILEDFYNLFSNYNFIENREGGSGYLVSMQSGLVKNKIDIL